MRPKHRHYSPKPRQAFIARQLHTMAFTVESLTLLQGSFKAMEEVFERQLAIPNPKLPFALETFRSVKQKVADMLLAPGVTVAFDANEIVVIHASLQVHLIDLLCMRETPERNVLVAICHQVATMLPDIPDIRTKTHD